MIDNTIYITLEEIDDIIKKLVVKLFEYPNIQNSTTIYVVTGAIEKSSYFMSVLFLKHIKENSTYTLNKNFIFISNIADRLVISDNNDPIIMIDDMSYSGSQMSALLNKIYFDTVITKKFAEPNIYILLAGLNQVSLSKLSKVPTSKAGKTSYAEFIPSPFKLLYLEERLYKPMLYTLGFERYLNLLFLFSPFTSDAYLPIVSIYLDHKLADTVSTFTTALLYGPIIPNNVNVDLISPQDASDDPVEFDDFNLMYDDKTKLTSLLTNLNETNNTAFSLTQFNEIGWFVLKKFITNDIPDRPGNAYMSFKPFINNCNQDAQLRLNIADPEIIKFNYLGFMLPEDCLIGNCGVHDNLLTRYKTINKLIIERLTPVKYANMLKKTTQEIEEENIKITENNILIQQKLDKYVRISNKINSYRCPRTWYKNGEFKMTCIS